MHVLPFAGVSEAQSTAFDLREALHYFTVRFRSRDSQHPIGLQQVQWLMSQALGCRGWVDLRERLRGKHATRYLATELWKVALPEHIKLAKQMAQLLGASGDEEVLRNLRRALSRCAFGCAPDIRQQMREMRLYVGYTVIQAGQLMGVDLAYDYHSRYNNLRTPYQIRLLRYERDKAYAQITGTRLPARPRQRGSDSH